MSETENAAVEADAPKVNKSIVPAKYGSKYKKGGTDELAVFINEQSAGDKGFEFNRFFALCRANGIKEDEVAKYEGQIEAKQHGAPGRARMTLRNMLAPIARKAGKLKGNDGEEHSVALAPLPARAKATDTEAEAA